MAIEFAKECDPGQGFNFKQDEHLTVGYINTLVIGDANIAPDIKVVEPSNNKKFTAKSGGAGAGQKEDAGTANIYTKKVVAVLSNVTWTTLPTDPIKFTGRVSVANMQLIQLLTIQSLPKVVVALSFIIYEYDRVANVYFPSFCSYSGTEPKITKAAKPGGEGWGVESVAKPVYGVLGKESNVLGLTVTAKPADDPDGITNHEFTLSVAPTVASETQQIKIQTSDSNKLLKGFGLPQA